MAVHLERECRNKPCAKYLEYCKRKYPCNVCHQKGHFAKDCSRKSSQSSQASNKPNSSQIAYLCLSVGSPSANAKTLKSQNLELKNEKYSYVTVSLSAGNINHIKSSSQNNRKSYQDCAAAQHMTSHKDLFTNYAKLDEPTYFIIGDVSKMEAVGTGDIYLESYNGDGWKKIILTNVLHVPEIPFNLFSVIKMLDRDHSRTADSQYSKFLNKDNEIIVMAERDGDLFKMKFREPELHDQMNLTNAQEEERCMIGTPIKVWQERLAHQNVRHTKEVLKLNNINFTDDWGDSVCEGCVYGKQHRISHPENKKVAGKPLDVVHVDLGEIYIRSLGGEKYFLLQKNDFSHFRTTYFFKTKDEAVKK